MLSVVLVLFMASVVLVCVCILVCTSVMLLSVVVSMCASVLCAVVVLVSEVEGIVGVVRVVVLVVASSLHSPARVIRHMTKVQGFIGVKHACGVLWKIRFLFFCVTLCAIMHRGERSVEKMEMDKISYFLSTRKVVFLMSVF